MLGILRAVYYPFLSTNIKPTFLRVIVISLTFFIWTNFPSRVKEKSKIAKNDFQSASWLDQLVSYNISYNKTLLAETGSVSLPINSYSIPENWAEETEPTNQEILESQAVEAEKKLISEVELHNQEHFLVPKDLIKFDNYSELYLDANAEVCKRKPLQNRVLVVIPSRTNNYNKRVLIRNTWADLTLFTPRLNYTFIYFVGRPQSRVQKLLIQAEQSLFGDVVTLNQVDHYFNLTLKMLSVFTWVQHHCPDSLYVYKIDDDVYVNLENMEKRIAFFIKRQHHGGLLYGGRCHALPLIIRDNSSKFFVSNKENPHRYFPPYCEVVPRPLLLHDDTRDLINLFVHGV
ncbi:beta-1,3-galactosyltransferase 9-like isoform X2 [Convolutriloba macropyga]|uniref:beta-1,3-galactosyltransferase 9-like isoform X2 n=1 Tax=Convolutriloba macropyga TaxID=536237 RepID=UPI003F51AF7F